MNTFDPAEVRKAVAEFTPRRPQKFQDLIPAREVIVELRQKSASYHSIADLLTQPHFISRESVHMRQLLPDGVAGGKKYPTYWIVCPQYAGKDDKRCSNA